MDCSRPGFPVTTSQEFAQTHVHWVSDSIQPFHPVFPFSFCPKSFPLFGFFLTTWLFASGGQNIGASAYQSLCFRKGDTFQGLKWGSCPTLRNELSKEMHVLTKQEILWEGHPGGEQEGQGTQGNCSATWLAVSGFMVMGLVSGLSLNNHSDSEYFLVVHSLFSQDGCQREGFWEVVGHMVSPFDLSWTLPVGGGLLVPSSLAGPPVVKQLMQMVTMVPGQGEQF